MDHVRRYGLIGAGMMGREHVRSLAFVEGAKLTAIAEPDRWSRQFLSESLAQTSFNPEVYDDWREMAQREALDAIIIATPNHTHFEIMDALFDSDTALLTEKPMCTALADAKSLHERAKARKALTHVGLEYRYMPPVARFIDRVHAGETGRPQMMMIREHRFPFLPKVGDWNRFNENTGGTLVEKCCHFFDLMRLTLQDEPIRVFASAGQDVNHKDERYDGRPPDILDNAFVTFDFSRGGRAVLDLCMFAEGAEQQEDISVIGDRAKLEVQIPRGEVVLSPRDRSGPSVEPVPVDDDHLAAGHHHGATVYHLRDFHNALVHGNSAPVSTLDGLRSVQMGLAAQESAATGQAISLDFS